MDDGVTLVTLSSASHHELLVGGLWNLFASQNGVDLEIKCDDQIARVHRIIAEIFLPLPKVVRGVPIDVAGLNTSSSLECLMEFMYRGTVVVREDRLESLQQVAKQLGFQLLVDVIEATKTEEWKRSAPGSPDPQKSSPGLGELESKADDGVEPKLYKCHLCKFKSYKYQGYHRHLLSTHGVTPQGKPVDKKYRCDDCDFECIYLSFLKKHKVAKHSGDKSSNTAKNDDPLPLAAQPDQSIQDQASGSKQDSTNALLSDEARDEFVRPNAGCSNEEVPLKKLKKMYENDEPKLYKCRLCKFKSYKYQGYHRHLLSSHGVTPRGKSLDKKYKCPECDVEFIYQSFLKKHLTSKHSRSKPLKCRDVSQFLELSYQSDFLQRNSAKNGSQQPETHRYQLRPSVKEAPKLDLNNPGGSARLLTNDGTKRDQTSRPESGGDGKNSEGREPAITTTKDKGAPRLYKCCLCNFESFKYQGYHRHLLSSHGVTPQFKPLVKNYKCTECDYECIYPSFLKSHQLSKHSKVTENKLFKCPHCPYEARLVITLKSHIKTVHLGVAKTFLCTTCGKLFGTATKLKHHTRVHTKENPYKCPHCPYACNWKNALDVHVNGVHLNVRQYQCTVCGKGFVSASHLRQHNRTHTKEKPYKCPHCSYAASMSGTLKTHVDGVHLDIRPHACSTCGMRFVTGEKLARHNRTHLKEKNFQCNICGGAFGRRDYLKEHLKNVHKAAMDS